MSLGRTTALGRLYWKRRRRRQTACPGLCTIVNSAAAVSRSARIAFRVVSKRQLLSLASPREAARSCWLFSGQLAKDCVGGIRRETTAILAALS